MLIAAALACGKTNETRLLQDRQTQTAIVAEFNATGTAAAATQHPKTATPECEDKNILGKCKTSPTPRPTRTPIPTPSMPEVLRSVTVARSWTPYFEEADDIQNYDPSRSFRTAFGLVDKGVVVPVVEEIQGSRYLGIVLVGRMELRDINLDQFKPDRTKGARYMLIGDRLYITQLSGDTDCVKHKWGHIGLVEYCHGHFWTYTTNDEHQRIWSAVATIPKGVEYLFTNAQHVDPDVLPSAFTQAQKTGFFWYVVPVLDGRVEIRLVPELWLRARDIE